MTNDAGAVSGAAAVSDALARRIRRLDRGETLTIAEFAGPGIILWEVTRADNGIARPWYWDATPWERLSRDGSAVRGGDTRRREPRARLWRYAPRRPTRPRCGRSPPPVRPWQAQGGSLIAEVDLHGEVLTDVLGRDPLTVWYELLVQRRARVRWVPGEPRRSGCFTGARSAATRNSSQCGASAAT